MDENQLGTHIIGCAIKVHKALGPGLLEATYEARLAHEFAKAGIAAKRQFVVPVVYDGVRVDTGYRLDFLIEDRVVIELKAIEKIADIHRAQLLSYLKLGGFRLGYVINFNVTVLRDGVWRAVNNL